MRWKSASKIELSEKQEKILKGYEKGRHTPLHLKKRAEIILKASEGYTNNKIEQEMAINEHTVKIWRDRYSKSCEELKRIEAETPNKLRGAIEKVLTDEKRSGAPAKFTDEEFAAIIALACEEPAKLGVPFSHWTPQLLQTEVIKRGIVESISVRQIGRFLKRERFTAAPKSVLVESEHRRL